MVRGQMQLVVFKGPVQNNVQLGNKIQQVAERHRMAY